jgi:hypothetical protein
VGSTFQNGKQGVIGRTISTAKILAPGIAIGYYRAQLQHLKDNEAVSLTSSKLEAIQEMSDITGIEGGKKA